jgi:lactose/L-arabinose transport system ATP-binding protein
MNFLAGQVSAGGVEVPALRTSFAVPVTLPGAGSPVTLGMRPEHLELDPNGDTHQVDLTEALGGVSYAYLTSDSGEKLIVEERGDTRSSEGDRVGVKIDPARVMVFDAKTEARLR